MAMEEEEEADWDLLAVVRGFTSTVSAAPEVIQQHPAPPADHGGLIEQPLTSRRELRDEEPQLVFGTRPDASVFTLTSHLLQSVPTATSSSNSAPQTHQRSKKRKSLQKRVCHVPVEGLSSDMWAWRKYGQKPIKGSPYPRGYYKCSSSKGCPARKQVERNKSEPEMLIVTYTSEHNHPVPTHRNSLAGSTRQKPTNVDKADSPQSELELKEMLMNNDDFFVGFQHLNHDSDSGEFGGAIDSSITLPPPRQL